MKSVRMAACLSVMAVLVAPAASFARTDSPTARSLALGDAVRAIGMGTDGLYFNPGTIAQLTQYSVNFGYGYANWSQWHQAQVSFVDSQTNPWVMGGFGYSFGYANEAGDTMTHDIRSNIGFRYASDKLVFGLGLTMRTMNVSSDAYTAKSDWYWDMDIGAVLGIMKVFYIGIVGQNLVQNAAQGSNAAQVEIRNTTGYGRRTWYLAPRKLGVGIGISYSIFNMGIDCDVDFTSLGEATPSLMGGMEFVVANAVALRAGANWDRVGHEGNQEMRVSAGIGYVSKAVAVDVSYAHDVWDASGFYLQSTIRVFLP